MPVTRRGAQANQKIHKLSQCAGGPLPRHHQRPPTTHVERGSSLAPEKRPGRRIPLGPRQHDRRRTTPTREPLQERRATASTTIATSSENHCSIGDQQESAQPLQHHRRTTATSVKRFSAADGLIARVVAPVLVLGLRLGVVVGTGAAAGVGVVGIGAAAVPQDSKPKKRRPADG